MSSVNSRDVWPGESIGPSRDLSCQKRIAQANEALDKQDLGLAAYHYRLAQNLISSTTREPILAVDKRLHEAAQKILDQAAQDYQQGQYQAAMKAYDNVVAWMPGCSLAITAKEQLAAVQRDPAVQAMFREIKAKAFVAKAVAIVQGKSAPASQPAGAADDPREAPITSTDILNVPVERQLAAVETLQTVVRSYPSTPQADQCRQLLARLDQEPGFNAGLDQYRKTRDAKQAYELGRNYEAAGKKQQAIEQYRLACDRYPGSEWAKKSYSAMWELQTK